MKIMPINNWDKSERVVLVEPALSSRINADDIPMRRVNYYSGRTLTKETMDIETQHHDKHIAMFGRQISDGVVYGLELSAKKIPVINDDAEQVDQWHFNVTSGLGVTHAGDDVSIRNTKSVSIKKLPTYDDPSSNISPPTGIGVVVLEPIKAQDIVTDRTDSCEIDIESFPFEDQIYIDGARLLWYPWPEDYAQLPATTSDRLRNEIAYKIYALEKNNPDARPPWESVGVALALVSISTKGNVVFVDRHAVTRKGGASLTVLPEINANGNPFMWQSRTAGLTAHIDDILLNNKKLYPTLKHFRYLPPFGILPKSAMDFSDNSTRFFPSQYRIEAVPMPLEEIEIAIKKSMSLAPFDLSVPDRVKMLVPVPQRYYDADLLLTKKVDPIFIKTLSSLIARVKSVKQHREAHREMAPLVQGLIDPARIETYPNKDPEAVPDESESAIEADDFTLDVSDRQGEDAKNILSKLSDWFVNNMKFLLENLEKELLDANGIAVIREVGGIDIRKNEFNIERLEDGVFEGLVAIVNKYDNDIKLTNDHLDSGFMQLQSESYRLRQMILGNEKASELATSPALNEVFKGDLAAPSKEDVNKYFSKVKNNIVKKQPDRENNKDKTTISNASFATRDRIEFKAATPKISFTINNRLFLDTRPKSVSKKISGLTKDVFLAEAVGFKPEFTPAIPVNKGFGVLPVKYKYVNFFEKLYSPAIPLRTLGLKERVYQSASVRARSSALKTKAAVYESLAEIPINLNGINIKLDPNFHTIISKNEYSKLLNEIDNNAVKNVIKNRTSSGRVSSVITVSPATEAEIDLLDNDIEILDQQIELIRNIESKAYIELTHEDLVFFSRSGVLDPEPVDGDEAEYFSASVSSIEKAISVLRLVEQRLGIYELALIEIKEALSFAVNVEEVWKNEMTLINDNLELYRHDLTVTRVLFEEEKERVKKTNNKRKYILKNHVKQIAYVRPRMVSSIIDVPDRELYNIYKSKVPSCISRNVEPAGELLTMLNIFKAIPLEWFSHYQELLQEVKSMQVYKKMILKSSCNKSPENNIPVQRIAQSVKWERGDGFGFFENNVTQKIENLIKERQKIETVNIEKMTLKEVEKVVEKKLSLEDILKSDKGSSKLIKKAVDKIEGLENVAVCLLNRVGSLTPLIRLKWVEVISEFDITPSLKELSVLPNWGDVNYETRRELQEYVDWLFAQINNNYSKADALMNDLVRVCILLASYAPVSSIIRGNIAAGSKGKVGDYLDVNVDKGNVQMGMKVSISSIEKEYVQGVVEDMAENYARVRVVAIENKTQAYEVAANAQVRFMAQYPAHSL